MDEEAEALNGRHTALSDRVAPPKRENGLRLFDGHDGRFCDVPRLPADDRSSEPCAVVSEDEAQFERVDEADVARSAAAASAAMRCPGRARGGSERTHGVRSHEHMFAEYCLDPTVPYASPD